ncbi:MAG: TraR/DksA C4-type zinc finger protein [Acidobacteria bacterium]|nr:TraR/DksA C4-type zinc finger protein [Acidobacteriota bacterium]
MDDQEQAHYRRQLETLRAELRTTLDSDSDETRPVQPDRAIGRLTRQDAILSQQMALEIRRRNQARLGQIERAIERVEDGSYGMCVRCEEEISEPRLKVRPETPICIACAEGRAVR